MARTGGEPIIYKGSSVPGFDIGVGNSAPGDLWVDLTVPALKRKTQNNPDVWVSIEGPGLPLVFNKGANVLTPSAQNVITWRADVASTVTAVKGYRSGGTGATINARKNGSLQHLSVDLSLVSADTWLDGGAVQNTAYAVGDKLEIQITSVSGSPAQVAVLVEFTSP